MNLGKNNATYQSSAGFKMAPWKSEGAIFSFKSYRGWLLLSWDFWQGNKSVHVYIFVVCSFLTAQDLMVN
jgi:hypothetical protein